MCGDMNRAFTNGNTPIFPACSRGHVGIVRALVDRGADVNHNNKKGDTPLLLACRNSHRGVIKALIEKGADVNHVGRDGESPLLIVSRRSSHEIFKILVKSGADVNYVDPKNGETALTIAVRRNQENWFFYSRCNARYLLENTSVDVNGGVVNFDNNISDSTNALNIALKRRHLFLAKLLLLHGADHTRADNRGSFPLHSALYTLEGAQFFLDTYPDSAHQPVTTGGTTILGYLLFGGDANVDVFKYLVSRKVVDVVGDKVEGKTALEWFENMDFTWGDTWRYFKKILPYLLYERDKQRLTELCKIFLLNEKQRVSVVPHVLQHTCQLSSDLFEELSLYLEPRDVVEKKKPSGCECGYC